MGGNTLVKRAFDEPTKLDGIGFKTWIPSVRELASQYMYIIRLQTTYWDI